MDRELPPARLVEADVIPYLLQAGLIEPSAVRPGRVDVQDASRRNIVYRATSERGSTYVVKHSRNSGDPGLAREADVVRRLRSAAAETGLRDVLPELVAYDDRDQVLVFQSPAGGRTMREHQARGRFSAALAGAAGRTLARLHSMPPEAVGQRPPGLDPTWPLFWHRPRGQLLFEHSRAAFSLLRLVQESQALCEALDELRDSSQPVCVVHGDTRWENWIALPARGSRRGTRILMVDWEMAGPGEPALDVGAFFGEYLATWVYSIPIVDSRDPGRMLRYAARPLDRMQPAIRQFWATYQTSGDRRAPECSFLRAVRFAAVRLLQAAVEEADTSSELRGRTLCSMQLAVNILERPSEAAAHLLGLPLPAGML
jgi:aminoglycoside phosphotransferase (APT) family kinase protein